MNIHNEQIMIFFCVCVGGILLDDNTIEIWNARFHDKYSLSKNNFYSLCKASLKILTNIDCFITTVVSFICNLYVYIMKSCT